MERIADYIIRKINEMGVKHIFMLTGRGILYLSDAVAKNRNIMPVCTYHEQGASYAAMAYARVTNDFAACLVSTGCAATNAITACLCSYQDNLPVVFISGNNNLDENSRHTGMNIRTYGSQETDIISVVKPITKYAVMLEESDRVVYEIEKALHLAQEGRKGPVWIDVPLDVQNMRIDENEQEHFRCQDSNNEASELDLQIQRIVDDINDSERPVILIGGGTRGNTVIISKLVEKYRMPVVFSPAAADVYGSSHELSIGAIGSLGGTRAGNFTVQNADCIIAVGTKLCSQETGMKKVFARHAKVIVIDIDENEHLKKGVHIERLVKSDASYFFSKLFTSQLCTTRDDWTDKCVYWKKLFAIENETFVKKLVENDVLDIYSVASIIDKWLPEDATIITDAGFEELIVPSCINYKRNQRCLFPSAQGAMGYAIPAIIGAYEAGRRNIVCIVGDGSIMMNVQELQIIRAMEIPVKILVINNNMYAVIRKRQKDLFRKRTIGNDPSDGLPAPSFDKIADCFNFLYKRIEKRSELLQCEKCFSNVDSQEIFEIVCTDEQKYLHESYAINDNKKLVHRPIEDMAPFIDRDIIEKEMIVEMIKE